VLSVLYVYLCSILRVCILWAVLRCACTCVVCMCVCVCVVLVCVCLCSCVVLCMCLQLPCLDMLAVHYVV
jgi:hypothetical protein